MSESVWSNKVFPNYKKAAGDQEFDVVIVGGGSTGLSAAYFLKKAGKFKRDEISE